MAINQTPIQCLAVRDMYKSIKDVCGIYKITNILNGDFYIGSTNDMKERWRQHIILLSKNRSPNTHMQRAVNKYGIDNFTFEIIATTIKEYQVKLEQWFIDSLKPKYNICTLAHCPTVVQTKESIQKMLNTRKERGITNGEVKLYEYNLQGEYIKEWESISSVVRYLETSHPCVYNHLKGLVPKKIKNSIFRREKVTEVPPYYRQRLVKEKDRTIYKKDKEDNILAIYNTYTECANALNLNRKRLSNIIRTDATKRRGYKLEYGS